MGWLQNLRFQFMVGWIHAGTMDGLPKFTEDGELFRDTWNNELWRVPHLESGKPAVKIG